MVEFDKHLSVSFLASFLITMLSAGFAALHDNALWAFPEKHAHDWMINSVINLFFYAAPLFSLLFYYTFEAEAETNAEKAAALKGVPNVEWYSRLLSQFILALMWFLLGRSQVILFLELQCLFYASLVAWDCIVVIWAKKKDMKHLILHDTLGLIFTIPYSIAAWWLYEFKTEIVMKRAVREDEMLLFVAMIVLLAVSASANVANIVIASRRAKFKLGWHLLPRIGGVRGST
jgi:hypothetical protein